VCVCVCVCVRVCVCVKEYTSYAAESLKSNLQAEGMLMFSARYFDETRTAYFKKSRARENEK
jgi:hypothetical protein